MLYTSLQEVKTLLDIDPGDASEDKKLLIIIDQASNWIDEWLNVPGGISKKERTEYYDGTGTQKLCLRHRPVFTTPTPQVWIAGSGNYGLASGAFQPPNTELEWGTSVTLKIDQDDGSSRCGILIRPNNWWPKPNSRAYGLLSSFIGEGFGNIKITYTGGYTVDSMPSLMRQACDFLVARLNYIWPIGIELNSENYEERAVGFALSEKLKLWSLCAPMLYSFRNWKF